MFLLGRVDEAAWHLGEAVRLTQQIDTAALDTLAAACAGSGAFTRAVATVERALTLATAENQTTLRPEIEGWRASYEAGPPSRQ